MLEDDPGTWRTCLVARRAFLEVGIKSVGDGWNQTLVVHPGHPMRSFATRSKGLRPDQLLALRARLEARQQRAKVLCRRLHDASGEARVRAEIARAERSVAFASPIVAGRPPIDSKGQLKRQIHALESLVLLAMEGGTGTPTWSAGVAAYEGAFLKGRRIAGESE